MTTRRLPIYTSLLMVLCVLSACVDEVEQIVYDHAPVKTQFALMLPDMASKNGRMIDQVVQPKPETFGLEKIYLFPFHLDQNAGSRALTTASLFQGDNILNSNNNKVEMSNRVEGTQAVWFEDVMVPQNTNYFLMYGVQPKSTSWATDRFILDSTNPLNAQKQGFQDGDTKTTLYGENVQSPNPLSVVKFAPQPIFEPGFFGTNENYKVRKQWVLTYLGNLLAAGTDDNKWWNTANVDLKNLYNQWVGAPDGRNINASSKSILGMVEKLHRDVTVIETKVKGTTSNDSYPEAQKNKDLALITEIKKAILNPTQTLMETIALKVKVQLATPDATDEAAYPLTYSNTNGYTDPLFPTYIGLPDGALQVRLTPEKGKPAKVDFLHELRNEAIEEIYAFPAQQYYTSRSEIGVSTKDRKGSFNSNTTWEIFVKDNFTEDYVFPFARTLVLKTPVTYGMANLSTKVRFKPATEIKDSQGTVVTVPSLDLATFNSNSLNEQKALLKDNITLTGILVSDQREVGWDFTRESADPDPKSYFIYDRYLNAGADHSNQYQSKMFLTRDNFDNITPNYTLVYPSKVLKSGENDRIFVILEFENGKQPFYGVADALIPAHSRFYITYMMDARALDLVNSQQLFSSANMVDLQLTITGLSGAYNVLPDTRMIKVNLGIAAKIQWEDGFVFNDVEVNN